MISLTNYDFQWGRSELVIIYPDILCHGILDLFVVDVVDLSPHRPGKPIALPGDPAGKILDFQWLFEIDIWWDLTGFNGDLMVI